VLGQEDVTAGQGDAGRIDLVERERAGEARARDRAAIAAAVAGDRDADGVVRARQRAHQGAAGVVDVALEAPVTLECRVEDAESRQRTVVDLSIDAVAATDLGV